MMPNPLAALICIPLLVQMSVPVRAQGTPARIQIQIVEGQGAINTIGQRSNREPVVQVEDEDRKPVAGASVVFFLPNMGPGGTFADGATTLTTSTNAQGQAVARGIRFNSQPGEMQIRVAVSMGGLTTDAIITQTNVIAGAAASGGMSRTTKILIVVGVVAAAGIGAGIALGHTSGSSSTAPPGATITPGTPTVGGPQ